MNHQRHSNLRDMRIKIIRLTGYLLIQLLIPVIAKAQINYTDIPKEVKIQFMEDYISASAASWKKDGDKYLVNFTHHSHSKKSSYTPAGLWVYTETTISMARVPHTIQSKLTTGLKGYYIDKVTRIEERANVTYRFQIRNDSTVASVTYDSKGHLVQPITKG